MARSFVAGSSQYLEIDQAVITAYPFTVACWFNSDSATVAQTLFAASDKDVTNHKHVLQVRGDVAGDKVRCFSVAGGSAGVADTTTGYSVGTWHHACAVFASATSRAVFIDGGSKGTNATSLTPSGLDRTSLGRDGSSSPGVYMSGLMTWFAVWNVALADADVAILARPSTYPLRFRPADLVEFCPLWGRHSPEIGIVGRFDLTVTGATIADQPRLYTPILISIPRKSAAGAPAALEAAGTLTLAGTADLTTEIALAASGSLVLTGMAALDVGGAALESAGTMTLTGTAALTTGIALAASGTLVLTGTAEFPPVGDIDTFDGEWTAANLDGTWSAPAALAGEFRAASLDGTWSAIDQFDGEWETPPFLTDALFIPIVLPLTSGGSTLSLQTDGGLLQLVCSFPTGPDIVLAEQTIPGAGITSLFFEKGVGGFYRLVAIFPTGSAVILAEQTTVGGAMTECALVYQSAGGGLFRLVADFPAGSDIILAQEA